VTPSLPGGRRGNSLSTALFVPGETPGPVWSGQQRRVDGVSLLEGVAWYGVLRSTWSVGEKTGGAAVAGHHCFVTSPLLPFLFFLGMFLLLPQHFPVFELLYRCDCYINIAGRKPISREDKVKMAKFTVVLAFCIAFA
jgi:hypothetical protein